jgi:hypothetical protein
VNKDVVDALSPFRWHHALVEKAANKEMVLSVFILSSMLIRLGGVAAMVGGAASATLGVLTVLVVKYEISGSIGAIQEGGWELRVANMLLIGVLAAIAALHALQRRFYGLWGTLFALGAIIGLVMATVGWLSVFAGSRFLFALQEVAERIPIALKATALIMGVLGVVAASMCIVGLGIVTMSAGVLPRWCGATLIAGSPLGVGFVVLVISPLAIVGNIPGEVAWVLAGIAWIVVGYAVFRAAGRRIERPSRVQAWRRSRMLDFDTRRPDTPRPQEPDRPTRLHLFVDSSRQQLSVSLLVLVLIGIVIPVVLLENEIQFETTPAYNEVTEQFLVNNDGDTGEVSCAADSCHIVFTDATSPVQLASITADVEFGSFGAVSVEYDHKSTGDSLGTVYCFHSKGRALSALHLRLYTAKLLGTIDDCYIVVL